MHFTSISLASIWSPITSALRKESRKGLVAFLLFVEVEAEEGRHVDQVDSKTAEDPF